jgi:hypothetical protein
MIGRRVRGEDGVKDIGVEIGISNMKGEVGLF